MFILSLEATLAVCLQNNTLTVEEFHHSLQDVTNFPLRPFVLPFLRAYLPPLQRELSTQARLAKQVSNCILFYKFK